MRDSRDTVALQLSIDCYNQVRAPVTAYGSLGGQWTREHAMGVPRWLMNGCCVA